MVQCPISQKKVLVMNKNDLRYQKTEANIRNSYLKLSETLSCKEITIKNICEQALCSRNTFYLHYTSKEDLYHTLINELLASVSKAFEPYVEHAKQINTKHYIAYCDAIINSIQDNKKTLTVFIKSDNGIFFKQLYDCIEKVVYNTTSSISKRDDTTSKKLYAAYLAGSITGFVFEWLKNDDITDDEARKSLQQIHINAMTTFTKIL